MKKWYKILVIELLILIATLDFKSTIFISFFWIIAHECVHIIVANKFKCKFYNFKLNILGVNADFSDIDELSERNKLILYFSGPCFNLFMAVFLCFLEQYFSYDFIKTSIDINLSLGVFNLLPAYPLDGSRIYEILLSRKFLYKESKKITEIFSFSISIILFIVFNIMLFLHKVNISLFLAAILMTYTTFLEKEKTMYIIMGDMIKKVRKLQKHDYIENKCISVYYKKGLVNVLTLVDKNKFNSFYVLNDDMELLDIIHEDELIKALKEYGNITLEEYIIVRK
ncbi:site-2 protease family protein [Clostridium uliginosum]|uniref:Stage IV sporulation protein FB n=1 Tax=Clostridium uliginosum TaxID=119641 RepID=A0A1I1I9Z8_9CLOT|nr:site-2 protease family protein [Clostridium uliginosum]SFC31108.1 stage IV sporulation protein FB [Clostridium uliginosum]